MAQIFEPDTGKAERNSIRIHGKVLVSRQEAAALLSISQPALDYSIANKLLSVRRIGYQVLIRSTAYTNLCAPTTHNGSRAQLRKGAEHGDPVFNKRSGKLFPMR
jgi:hypothetical protein